MNTNGKTVLMVSDDFLPAATGVGVHIQTICRELVKKGCKVVVVTSRRKGQASYENWQGAHVHRYRTLCIKGFYQAFPTPAQIRALIRDENIGLVHFHYLSFMTVIVKRVSDAMGIPSMYTYHMTEDHLTQTFPMSLFRGTIRRAINRLCHSVKAIIFPSRKLMDDVLARGIKTPSFYLTNPLVPAVFERTPEFLVPVPITNTSPFHVLFAGRLNAEKNVPLLLRAFAKHVQRYPESFLWIVGEGCQRGELVALSNKLSITHKVQFLGFLKHEELASYYQACQVFVLPSFVETQGMVAMEAMRFKKPIIVSKEIVSAKELVDHGENGYLVDAHDESDLAARLDELAASEARRDEMGIHGFEKTNMYDPKYVVGELVRIYDQAMASA